MQPEDFMQISGRFHAEWIAESQRNLSGILAEWKRNRSRMVPESFQNPSGSLAESILALSRLDSMQPEDFIQISRRMGRGISAKSQRNRSEIVRES